MTTRMLQPRGAPARTTGIVLRSPHCAFHTCVGTGVEPTCKLPPIPFTEVLPQREFHWGGTEYAGDTGSLPTEDDAIGSPFPWSAQASTVPIVANLDDDNGDGLVNESDFPEILFMSYHDDNPNANGVVRAIHGGGPNKGKDYFALCGDNHWSEEAADSDDRQLRYGSQRERCERALVWNSPRWATSTATDSPRSWCTLENGGIRILNNKGEPILATGDLRPAGKPWNYPGPAIA